MDPPTDLSRYRDMIHIVYVLWCMMMMHQSTKLVPCQCSCGRPYSSSINNINHSSCNLRLLRSPQHQTNPHTGFYTSRDMFIRWWHIAQHIRHKKIAPFSTLGRRGSLSYHEYYDTHIVSFTFTYLYTDIIISKILHVHKRNDVLLDRARAGRHVRGVLKQPSFVPHFFFLTFWRGRSRKIRFLPQPFKFFFWESRDRCQ